MSAGTDYPMVMNAKTDAPLKIALIEPEARDVEWISEMAAACEAADVVDEIAEEKPDLSEARIILIGLERLGSLEAEALTKLHAGFPRIPMIVLAGPDAAARAGEAVSLGAQHVLAKSDLTPAKLSSTLRYYSRYVPDEPTHTA